MIRSTNDFSYSARQHAKQFDRKTIGPQDIINALEKAEFSSFIPSVSEELDSFQARKDAQKKKKREEKLAQALAQSQTQVTTQSDVVPDQKMKEASEETIDEQEDNGNETVEEVDSMETLDNDETQVEETRGPVSKKLKSDSREDTVSDAETESQQEWNRYQLSKEYRRSNYTNRGQSGDIHGS